MSPGITPTKSAGSVKSSSATPSSGESSLKSASFTPSPTETRQKERSPAQLPKMDALLTSPQHSPPLKLGYEIDRTHELPAFFDGFEIYVAEPKNYDPLLLANLIRFFEFFKGTVVFFF